MEFNITMLARLRQNGFINLGIIGLIVLTAGLFAATKLASNPDLTFFNISEKAKEINEEDSCRGCLAGRELRWRKITKKDGAKEGRCVSIVSAKCKVKPTPKATGCFVTGCNGDLCVDKSQKDIATICVTNPAASCYKSATCEKQKDGKCSWTQTTELITCLKKYQ